MADTPISVSDMLAGGTDPTLEQRLQQRRNYAALGVLMGTQPTMAVGELLLKDAREEHEARRGNKRKYLGNGFIMDPDGTVTRDEGMAAAELEREGRLLKRMGYQNDLITNRQANTPSTQLVPTEGGMVPVTTTRGGTQPPQVGPVVPIMPPPSRPTSAQEEDARRWSGVADDVSALKADVQKAPSINDAWRAGVVGLAGQVAPSSVAGVARNYATEKVYPKDELPTVINLRQKFHSVLQAMSGLATTDSERANLQAWAAAEGQGPQAMQAALAQMEAYAHSRARAATGRPYAGAAPSQQGGAVEWERGPDGRPRRKQ